MSRVLVVEDSATQALEIRLLLEDAGFSVDVAVNGREALGAIALRIPDLVLTDLRMPELDGLELVEAIRAERLSVPVILMTQHGTEEVAVQALKLGAASYLAKKNLERDLVEAIDDVLAVTSAQRHQDQVIESLQSIESRYLLENNVALITPLIGHVHQNLSRMKFCDEIGLIRIGVALREALINAIHHGNLEVSSELRASDDDSYYDLVEERSRTTPYRERRVSFTANESRNEAIYVVSDEGPGFDPACLPDPTDPANLHREYGRGLLLIRTFMDEVRHNPRGNEITLIKRRGPA
ncbi:response regulator [Tundrisphaera lichenicola]|uniref:ATP-binding protein n=1 Tax=Tundrisphaera lichenicola TaxID=2029860 RepID=UPI003EB97629